MRLLQELRTLLSGAKDDETLVKALAILCAADGVISKEEVGEVKAYLAEQPGDQSRLLRTFETYARSFISSSPALNQAQRKILEELKELDPQEKVKLTWLIQKVADADGRSAEERPVLNAIYQALTA